MSEPVRLKIGEKYIYNGCYSKADLIIARSNHRQKLPGFTNTFILPAMCWIPALPVLTIKAFNVFYSDDYIINIDFEELWRLSKNMFNIEQRHGYNFSSSFLNCLKLKV